MAETITITQDNIVNGSNLLPVHQPLVFKATLGVTVEPLTDLYVDLLDGLTVIGTYKMIPYNDISATLREFVFVANTILPGLMDSFEDELVGGIGGIVKVTNMNKLLTVRFYGPDSLAVAQDVEINFAHGVRQFGDQPNMHEVYNNDEYIFYSTYQADSGTYTYVYFYATDAIDGSTVEFYLGNTNLDSIIVEGNTLYKTKIEPGSDTTCRYVVLGQPDVTYTHQIIGYESCPDGKTLKYLDKNDQYRFIVFNEYYQINDKPKKIGSTNEFITSIYDGQTNSKNIGYKNTRRLLLTTDADAAQLLLWSEIYNSPRVYLHIGTGDELQDWVEVEINGDNIVKRRKKKSGSFDVAVKLPEHFTISMI